MPAEYAEHAEIKNDADKFNLFFKQDFFFPRLSAYSAGSNFQSEVSLNLLKALRR